MHFIRLRKDSFISSSLRILSWINIKFCQMLFLCIYYHMISLFIILMWWIILIDFWLLNQFCISWYICHWLRNISSILHIAGLDLLIFCWEFYIYSWTIFICNFISFEKCFGNIFVYLYLALLWLHKMS